jgi:hypothetical protein
VCNGIVLVGAGGVLAEQLVNCRLGIADLSEGVPERLGGGRVRYGELEDGRPT